MSSLNENQFIQLKALVELKNERDAQDKKWGQQNYEIGAMESYAELADVYKKRCATGVRAGVLTWADILLEEVYEALAEVNPIRCRQELVQAGAVIVAMIECIDRKKMRSMGECDAKVEKVFLGRDRERN